MFLKKLEIKNNDSIIRTIDFHKGINLIIDETKTINKKESGNNVGKTTVLRLIDFCLGGKGVNIYKDPEFKDKGSNSEIEAFLKNNNIIIVLTLKDDLDIELSEEIIIEKNFLIRNNKIQKINGKSYKNEEFLKELKKLIFKSETAKPTFRQIIAKNIRDEKSRLINTVKVLHPTTKQEEYESLFLFWLGVSVDNHDRKQQLLSLIKIENNLQKRLKKENNLSQIEQSLIIVNRSIDSLQQKKDSFNLNEDYENELEKLNLIKAEINKLSTLLSQLELRKSLILESKDELDSEIAKIDVDQIKLFYEEAKSLLPDIQKSFDETLQFHNEMLIEKKKFITKELPDVEQEILSLKRKISDLILKEKDLSSNLKKNDALDELQTVIFDLNDFFEKKGKLEEQKRLWTISNNNINEYNLELENINKGIDSKENLINERITNFNKFFSDISLKLYAEQFVLSPDKNKKGYGLVITTISGNPGTGKKKGQIAAFDLAYIQFAELFGIECLHFILHDQIENIHNNQINSLLNEIVANINCQYVLPVLRDKLPADINVDQYEILSLSQSEKLFKV